MKVINVMRRFMDVWWMALVALTILAGLWACWVGGEGNLQFAARQFEWILGFAGIS